MRASATCTAAQVLIYDNTMCSIGYLKCSSILSIVWRLGCKKTEVISWVSLGGFYSVWQAFRFFSQQVIAPHLGLNPPNYLASKLPLLIDQVQNTSHDGKRTSMRSQLQRKSEGILEPRTEGWTQNILQQWPKWSKCLGRWRWWCLNGRVQRNRASRSLFLLLPF